MRKPISFTAVAIILGLVAACGSEDTPPPADMSASAAPAPVAAQPTETPASSARPSTGEMLAYAEVEGTLARGYLAYPSDMIEPLPAIMLLHDWFGLDENVKTLAKNLASQGYVVLAVDLFDGRTGTLPRDTRDALVRMLEKPELTRTNLEQAIMFVRETVGSPRLAMLGFGSGGLWSLNTALATPDEFRALILVQGQTLPDADRLETLSNVPMLGIYGAADRSIPQDAVREFGDALTDAEVTHTIRLYPTAGNAFMLRTSRNYSPKQAESAWEVIHEFLSEHLAGETPVR
ncbi:MAG: dienelactone hydrolase family protein [Pseudomonadota bacterium]